ncbi:MAG: hypothetical protein PVI43_01510, partial [Candidatus Bathyarchaeota archaeon]
YNNVTLDGNCFADVPRFRGGRYPAIIVFGVDDYSVSADEGFDYFQNIADLAESYGFGATYFLNTLNVSGAHWTALDAEVAAGHDVVPHGRRHIDHSSLDGITIRYTGDASTAVATIAVGSDSITTTLAGDQTDGSSNLSIDISSYDTLAEIVIYINGQTGYTASTKHATGYNDSASPIILADITDQDIKTADYDMQIDQDRVNAEEIAGAISDIESNLSNISQVVAWSYPYNQHSAATKTYLQGSTNVIGSRGDIDDEYVLDGIDPYVIRTKQIGWMNDGGDVAAATAALCETLSAINGVIELYAHDTGEFSYADWAEFFATLQKCNVQVMTKTELVNYIAAMSSPTDRADFELEGGSFARLAGTDTPYSSEILDMSGRPITDSSGNALGGGIDIGAYRYFGGVKLLGF